MARKIGDSTALAARLNPLAPSDINKNYGRSSEALSDADNLKLTCFFAFLQDDLE